MAAGNVGYTDTRSFSGSLLGDLARGIKDRVKSAAQMARDERAFSEEQARRMLEFEAKNIIFTFFPKQSLLFGVLA